MATQELINLIKQKISHGESKEAITTELLRSKWSRLDIDQGFSSIGHKNTFSLFTPLQPTPALIITALLLFLFYPVGIICMWVLMKNWPLWLKVFLTSLPALILLALQPFIR